MGAVPGGFVAIAGYGPEAGIVTSPDGRVWTAIPPPPEPPDTLAIRDNVLYVLSGLGEPPTWPPTVHATVDWGATWTRVPVEPGPNDEMVGRAAVAVAAGEAGVVIAAWEAPPSEREPVGVEASDATVGPFWVLGEDGFERVDAPFIGDPGFVNVWAVGEGFLVQVGIGSRGYGSVWGTYWTSPDGRTWTEVLDAPYRLEIHAIHDGTVFGTAQVHENVVSTDGGRTWQPGLELPVGPPGDWLTVSDTGFVAVETVIFGPCVGVVWVSADGLTWQRVLNPWPTPGMWKPVISGNTILIESTTCGTSDDPVYWIGAVR